MTIWTPQLKQGKAIYLAIADALAQDIVDGILQAGDRLPAQRDLAWRLKVTLGTISRAYHEAEKRGLLNGEVGRGSYVRALQNSSPLGVPTKLKTQVINFRPAVPARSVVKADFDAALTHIMRAEERLELLDYTLPAGNPAYQLMGQKWLRRCGLEVDQKNILTTAGAHIGVIVSILSLVERGNTILAEMLNYPSLLPAFNVLGYKISGLSMDHYGLLPDALEEALHHTSSRLLYLVPTMQNPTTSTMPLERREAIVALARAYDLTIIEDDVFRLLDPRPQPPCFYKLAPERTFYITSLSKALAPGLRVGFMATPAGRSPLLMQHQKIANGNAVGIAAEIARYLLESNLGDTILARIHHEMMRRRQIFLEIFKGCDYRFEPYSLFGWLAVPEAWSAYQFAVQLESRGVSVLADNAFSLSPTPTVNHIRIGLGEPEKLSDIERGLKIIRSLMNEPPPDHSLPMA